MPLQNRVTPLGELVAVTERGLVYGNRGCLHDRDGRIRRRYAVKRWIACRLEFKGRRRKALLQPGRYTELFFLDEATAFAAGHRPCAECRRAERRRARRTAACGAQRRPAVPRAVRQPAGRRVRARGRRAVARARAGAAAMDAERLHAPPSETVGRGATDHTADDRRRAPHRMGARRPVPAPVGLPGRAGVVAPRRCPAARCIYPVPEPP